MSFPRHPSFVAGCAALVAGLLAGPAGCAAHRPPVTDPVADPVTEAPVTAPARHYNLKTPAALAAALHDAAGYEGGPDQCGGWMDDTIYLVASFADDYGCAADGYFADGWYQPSRATSAPGLQLLGWADASQRPALALRWVREVLAGGDEVVSAPEPGTPLPADPSPAVEMGPAGAVTVDVWFRQPVGMQPGTIYSHMRYTFDDAGAMTLQSLATVEVP